MKGFKDSTRTQYAMGGAAYAKGGAAKGAAKVAKVMGEFKRGELHSGSKSGPEVTSPKQAKAIAMSEARKAGMKAPMKKAGGGDVKMPPIGESAKSGNRVQEQEAAADRAQAEMMRRDKAAKRDMKKRVPATRREPLLPSIGDTLKSSERVREQEAAADRAMGVYKKGGLAAMPQKGKC
jgi:hypothetical protein